MSPLKAMGLLEDCSGRFKILELDRWVWDDFRTLFDMVWRHCMLPSEEDKGPRVYLIRYFDHTIRDTLEGNFLQLAKYIPVSPPPMGVGAGSGRTGVFTPEAGAGSVGQGHLIPMLRQEWR